nr:MAG TPA: hypothetical protein [Caudoviricetes sp.]
MPEIFRRRIIGITSSLPISIAGRRNVEEK